MKVVGGDSDRRYRASECPPTCHYYFVGYQAVYCLQSVVYGLSNEKGLVSNMAEDRLKKDYDIVENLDDLIEAREERDSAFSDSVDAMQDIDVSKLPDDPNFELTRPHHHKPSEEEQLGIDVELMDTPDENQIEFDWQDSVEEMLPTDPDPSEGMGEDGTISALGHMGATDIAGPVPSVEVGSETGTDYTKEEKEEFNLDGGKPQCPPPGPVQVETAMDTDSDEMDFTIEEKFAGEVDHTTAEYGFEQMREATEEKEPKEK